MNARPVVDFWFDPVCPYSWTASRWLEEVAAWVPLDVRHHVMILSSHVRGLTFPHRRRAGLPPKRG